GRAAEDHINRPPRNLVLRDNPATRLHHEEISFDRGLQVGEIPRDKRLHVGVQDGRRRALVFPKLAEDVVAHGDRKSGEGLSDYPLVLRPEEGEEEADCDGLRVPRAHLSGDATGLSLRERTEGAASRVDALAGTEAHLPDDGWRRSRDPEIVEVRPVLA